VENHIVLAWQTYSEIESLGFELERSQPGHAGSVIGSYLDDTALEAKSPSGAFYQTIDDKLPASGRYIYDLYQIDKNGVRSHVASQSIDFSEIAIPTSLEVAIYPNPATQTARVEFDLPADAAVRLDLYDITGRVAEPIIEGNYTAGPHAVSIDLSTLAAGAYNVILTSGNQRLMRGILIQK